MLVRLAYLGITNAFALLRLLPGCDRDKDAEILALRHQLAVLQRQLGGQKVRFRPADRALLAALLSWLPRPAAGACVAGASGHGPALAPRRDRPPPRRGITPAQARAATHCPVGPGPSVATGPDRPD